MRAEGEARVWDNDSYRGGANRTRRRRKAVEQEDREGVGEGETGEGGEKGKGREGREGI